MRIQPQLFTTQKNTSRFNIQTNRQQDRQCTSATYNPIYYQDYNVSFGARLFRTPANFFAQTFNQNNMPDTMKEYLNGDYEDRQNIPPMQMMKIVFEPIKLADNLEEVKEIFPDEPLFANLSSTPNRKAREGVLAEIELMRDGTNTLFKNGKDDLGMYLINKIYLEGKSLKEINVDFKKDISVAYKGLSDIDYKTFDAYGIKFPKRAFWKSFLATREDFPYEYKPRKAVEHSQVAVRKQQEKQELTLADILKKPVQKKKFDDVKEWEIEKISDVIVKGKGNTDSTQKALKKSSVNGRESANFVTKYMGQIMSVALEKIDASGEMRSFWAGYDTNNKSQKQIMNAYWNTSKMQALQSLAMKDTIKLFMEAYGVDGNNEEFQQLIEYADSIAPARKERDKEHDLKQKEYDEMFAALDKLEEENEDKSEAIKVFHSLKEELETIIEALKPDANNNVELFNTLIIEPNEGTVKISPEMEKKWEQQVLNKHSLLPTSFTNKYLLYLKKHPLAVSEYRVVNVIDDDAIRTVFPDFLSKEEAEQITQIINMEFKRNNPILFNNTAQAIVDTFDELGVNNSENVYYLNDINEYLEALVLVPQEHAARIKSMINERFNVYQKPLSNSEILKIMNAYSQQLIQIDPDKLVDEDRFTKGLYAAIKANIQKRPLLKKNLKKTVATSELLKTPSQGHLRALIDPNTSDKIKLQKVIHLTSTDPQLAAILHVVAASDMQILRDVVRPISTECYDHLVHYHNKLEVFDGIKF